MIETGYNFRLLREGKWGPVDFVDLTSTEMREVCHGREQGFVANLARGLTEIICERGDKDLLVNFLEDIHSWFQYNVKG